MGVFQDTIKSFAPPWFLNQAMGTLLESVGATYDDLAQRVFDGRRAGNPWANGSQTDLGVLRQCDPDAFPYHSRDRGIRLYSSEPTLSQRYRLGNWHQIRKQRGSHIGELFNVQPFFLAGAATAATASGALFPTPWMRVVFQSNEGTPTATWYTIDPAGTISIHRTSGSSNWNYDGNASKWSRFWFIIHLPPGYSSEIAYDAGFSYDAGYVYDGITALAIQDIVAGIKEAKAAHSRLAAVIVTTLQPTDVIPGQAVHPFDPTSTSTTNSDGSTNLPTGSWNVLVNSSNQPTRPNWASWIYEDKSLL